MFTKRVIYEAVSRSIWICFFLGVAYNACGQNQVLANGSTTTAFNFPGSGCVYNWVNDNPTIGLVASGTGNIPSFTAVNNTNMPITATITATPVSAGFAYIFSSIGYLSIINTATKQILSSNYISTFVFSVAVSPDGKNLYLTDPSSNEVFFMDAATFEIKDGIFIGSNSRPRGITTSPDGSKIYVVNEYPFYYTGTGTITVIDAVTHKIITTVVVGNSPLGIIVSPDGSKIYVGNQGSNSVSVISSSTNTLLYTIPVGGNPNGIIGSHDGGRMYVANGGSSTVSVIDVATHAAISTIGIGGNPVGITITPDDKYVYVVNEDDRSVSVIDTQTLKVIATIPLAGGDSPFGISVSPDGREVYAVNQNGLISVIGTATNLVTSSIKTLVGPISFGNFISSGPGCSSSPMTFTIKVNPTPKIVATASLIPFSTIYGTASASAKMLVSGANLNSGIILTAPTGFEISGNNSSFVTSLTLPPDANGSVALTPVYIRLKSTTPVGSYSGNITLSSIDTQSANLSITGVVNPATLIITANPVSKIYGSMLVNTINSTAFAITGIQNGETIDGVTITYSKGANINDHPGVYLSSIIVSSATGGNFISANYHIIYINGDITVQPAPLIIIADNQSKFLGAPDPQFTVSYRGFVNNDDPLTLTRLPQLSTTATSTSSVGEYPIIASDAASPDYVISYTAGILTIYFSTTDIAINNTFTPNGDNINDLWIIKGLQYYPECVVKIFNRYGLQLYRSLGYNKAWDGTFNGKPLPVGTYYYIINFGNVSPPRSGFVSIIR
jgi:gliding motility-associated-like protein